MTLISHKTHYGRLRYFVETEIQKCLSLQVQDFGAVKEEDWGRPGSQPRDRQTGHSSNKNRTDRRPGDQSLGQGQSCSCEVVYRAILQMGKGQTEGQETIHRTGAGKAGGRDVVHRAILRVETGQAEQEREPQQTDQERGAQLMGRRRGAQQTGRWQGAQQTGQWQ